MTQTRDRRIVIWPAAFLLATALLGGCSQQSDQPTTPQPSAEPTADLNAPNGGFTESAEEAGFGDPELLASAQAETEVEDPIADQPAVRDWLQGPASRVYLFTAEWGRLDAPPPTRGSAEKDGDEFDWTGHMTVGQGAIVLRSTISFEREDSLLPRTVRTDLGWISHTGDGFDGIRVLILEPATGPDPQGGDSLTFVAGAFNRGLTIAQLDSLDEVIEVDGQGNQIHLRASRQDPTAPTLTGILRGSWERKAPGDSVGHFQGLWEGRWGHLDGFFRGIYGSRPSGEQVFYGKIVDRQGRFLGFMRGTWGEAQAIADPTVVGAGWFRGDWLVRSSQKVGQLSGHWRVTTDSRGVLRGGWCRGCGL